MDAIYAILALKAVPRILLELLVTERKTTVVLVNLKNYNLELCTNLCELAGVLNLLVQLKSEI